MCCASKLLFCLPINQRQKNATQRVGTWSFRSHPLNEHWLIIKPTTCLPLRENHPKRIVHDICIAWTCKNLQVVTSSLLLGGGFNPKHLLVKLTFRPSILRDLFSSYLEVFSGRYGSVGVFKLSKHLKPPPRLDAIPRIGSCDQFALFQGDFSRQLLQSTSFCIQSACSEVHPTSNTDHIP